MIYRSNIDCPDLRPQFAASTICRVRDWSMGHDVLSDSKYEPDCTFMTFDEAAILYECARRSRGAWLDIGSRFGWSTAHIQAAGCDVLAVDPQYQVDERLDRFESNFADGTVPRIYGATSSEFFENGITIQFDDAPEIKRLGALALFGSHTDKFGGICIDGNHDSPEPLNDARNALKYLCEDGVIVLHDFWGQPIRDAAVFLMDNGLKCRVYDTPNGMAVCWRGDFVPPDHEPDPAIDWTQVRSRAPEFDFSRCE